MFFPFAAILLLTAFPIGIGFPFYIAAVILLSLVYLGTYIPYVVVRNKAVPLHEKVFTPDWFRYELAYIGSKVGLKIEAERKAEYEKGPPIDLMAIAANRRSATTRPICSPPGSRPAISLRKSCWPRCSPSE